MDARCFDIADHIAPLPASADEVALLQPCEELHQHRLDQSCHGHGLPTTDRRQMSTSLPVSLRPLSGDGAGDAYSDRVGASLFGTSSRISPSFCIISS